MRGFVYQWIQNRFDQFDRALTGWMSVYSVVFLRYSLALIFLWFGALKFIPGMSPTVSLIEETTRTLGFEFIPTWVAVYALATVECLIGVGLLLNICMRITLLGLFVQMFATSIPILLLPEAVFTHFPFGLSMEGHHIVKNLIIIGAGFSLGAQLRNKTT